MDAINPTPTEEDATAAVSTFEPAQMLAQLLSASKATTSENRPERLPLQSISRMPELFQPRGGVDEKHVDDLMKAVKAMGILDPVTVLAVGERAVLMDGHHRLEAYERAGKTVDIPVAYFDGTPQEAVLAAGEANSKAKLPMTSQERQDYAWRLILIGLYSKAKVAQASGVSQPQVAIMRRARKDLGEDAEGYKSWFKARYAWKKKDEQAFSEDDTEQWKQQVADRYADTLVRTFSMRLANNPEIAAMALAAYFGRRLPEIVNELRGFLPEDDGEEDDF